MPEVLITDSSEQLARTAAGIFLRAAGDRAARAGRFAVALSGGHTPRRMHRMLAEEPFQSEIPWASTHVFWVDERCVPYAARESNFGTAQKDFLDFVPIPESQVKPMPAYAEPEKAAALYQTSINDFFRPKRGGFPVFDLIFLGVGEDGHTASLFPGQPSLEEEHRWVVAVEGGAPHVGRLTLTRPVLNHARHVVFLVSGEAKAGVIRAILEKKADRLPAARIRPVHGKLTWLLDRRAASLIPSPVGSATA